MTTGWMIRIYNEEENNTEKTERFFGNFATFGRRTLDQLLVFQGIYGNGDYLKWSIHKDQIGWDFNTGDNVEVRLYSDMNPSLCFFFEHYKIVSVASNRSRIMVIAKSIDSIILETKLTDFGVQSINVESIPVTTQEKITVLKKEFPEYNKILWTDKVNNAVSKIIDIFNKAHLDVDPYSYFVKEITRLERTLFQSFNFPDGRAIKLAFGVSFQGSGQGFVPVMCQLVKDEKYVSKYTIKNMFEYVFEFHNIFTVCYHTNEHEDKLRPVDIDKYTYYEGWKIKDFINFYMGKFEFEWTVKDGVLHIGKELRAIEQYSSSGPIITKYDTITKYGMFMKYSGRSRPTVVLSHMEKKWRCLWVKHSAGRDGGRTHAFFVRIGSETLDKELYINSLEGRYEKNLLRDGVIVVEDMPYVSKGTIYPTPDAGTMTITSESMDGVPPEEVKRRTEESLQGVEVEPMTPYMEHKGGMFFPVVNRNFVKPGGDINDKTDWIESLEPIMVFEKGDPSKPHPIGYSVENQTTYILGSETTLKPPLKGSRDFLLTLPKNANDKYGPTFYVDGYYGKILIQCEGVNPRIDEDKIDTIHNFDDVETYKNEAIHNFFPYPKDADFDGNEAEDGSSPVDEEIVTIDDFNPTGQTETYIYMRPKNTEAKGTYNQISLNAGGVNGVKVRLRDINGEGVEIWRGGNKMVRILKSKIVLEVPPTNLTYVIELKVGNTTLTVNNDGVNIT